MCWIGSVQVSEVSSTANWAKHFIIRAGLVHIVRGYFCWQEHEHEQKETSHTVCDCGKSVATVGAPAMDTTDRQVMCTNSFYCNTGLHTSADCRFHCWRCCPACSFTEPVSGCALVWRKGRPGRSTWVMARIMPNPDPLFSIIFKYPAYATTNCVSTV